MKDIKNKNLKVINSSAYDCCKLKAIKTFNKYKQLTMSLLFQFRCNNIRENNVDLIVAQYDSVNKLIILRFKSCGERYDSIFKIKNRRDYQVMMALLDYMNLLDKVKVISNASKTKRQRSR